MCDHVPAVPVRFDIPIPEDDQPKTPLLWGKRGERLKVLITSRTLTSCFTHFIKGRTRPCYSPHVHCPGCAAGYARIWRGFVGGLCWFSKIEAIAMLTVGAVRPWKARFEGRGEGMRGYLMTLEHQGGEAHGACKIDLQPVPRPGRLPDPFDVEARLKSMWARWAALQPPDDKERWESIPVPGF